MHHTPGRLRLKHPRLTDDAGQRDRFTAYARVLHGVRRVDFNETTGSLVIRYDTDALDGETLVALLNMHGGLGRLDAPLAGCGTTGVFRVGRFGDALVETAVSKTIEVCVGALVSRLW